MDDLPEGPALLGFARDVLVHDLLPLLPAERRLDARLIANCMAIAAREAAVGREPEQNFERELSALYEAPTLTLPRVRGRVRVGADHGEGAVGVDRGEGAVGVDRGEGACRLLHRFARDLRIGAFENSAPRAATARAILWRMTVARLRLANPRFLAANGLAEPKG